VGDDIGWMQPSIYHRGLMVGETPNIDRIGAEGAMFTDYYAEQTPPGAMPSSPACSRSEPA
jgi:arylsulfatase